MTAADLQALAAAARAARDAHEHLARAFEQAIAAALVADFGEDHVEAIQRWEAFEHFVQIAFDVDSGAWAAAVWRVHRSAAGVRTVWRVHRAQGGTPRAAADALLGGFAEVAPWYAAALCRRAPARSDAARERP